MSYVWGMRGTCKRTPLTEAIKGELYVQPYGSINWNAARNQCAKQDLYYPHPVLQARRPEDRERRLAPPSDAPRVVSCMMIHSSRLA